MIQFDQMPAAPGLLNGVVRPPAITGASYTVRSALAALQGQHIESLQRPVYAVPPTPEQYALARHDPVQGLIPPAILKVHMNTMFIKSAQKVQQGR